MSGIRSYQLTVRVTLVELVSDPDVPVIVSVLEPVGVPPVGVWWLPQPAKSTTKPKAAVIKLSLIESLRRRSKNRKKVNSRTAADKIALKADGGGVNMKCPGVTNEGLTVATETVATTGVMPSEGVTDEGEIVQVDIAGAPLHASAMAALNPPVGVTVTLNATVSP
jgi:hypothetical protein